MWECGDSKHELTQTHSGTGTVPGTVTVVCECSVIQILRRFRKTLHKLNYVTYNVKVDIDSNVILFINCVT